MIKETNSLTVELQSLIQGEVSSSLLERQAYATNFGRSINKLPQLIVKAACEEDVYHTLRLSEEAALPISIRGAGHSCHNHSLTDGGIVLINFGEKAEYKLLDDQCIEVSSRTPWLLLEKALNQQGRAIPVLPDYLNLTVGGTLSVGGYGRRSAIFGAQVDHVKSLELIKPNGEKITCSREQNQAYFHNSLTGLGQVGFIERVVMETIPYKKVTARYIYQHETTISLIDSLEWLTELDGQVPLLFNGTYGLADNWTIFGLEYPSRDAALYSRLPKPLSDRQPAKSGLVYDAPLQSHRFIESLLERTPDFCNLWVDFFLEYSALHRFMKEINLCLQDQTFSRYVTRANILAIKNPEHKPCGIFRPFTRNSETLFSIGLYPSVPPEDSAGLKHVKQLLRQLLERCLELEGFPYLYGSYGVDDMWERLDCADLTSKIAESDPHQLFNRDPLSE